MKTHDNEPKILVVDDEASARDILVKQLNRLGYQAYEARDGKSGLEKVREIKPDLVMLDVIMPGMSGVEVCSAIRSTPGISDMPIVMVTGQVDDETKLEALSTGADDYVSKPVNVHEISARVQTIVRLNRYRKIAGERSRFEQAADLASEGIIVVNSSDEIMFANRKARQLLRLGADERKFTGQEMCEIIAPDGEPPPENHSLPFSLNSTTHLIWPANGKEACRLQVDPIALETELPGEMMFRITDVSSEVKEQLGRWGFASILCHKFRTPMGGISGNASLLEMDQDQLSAKHQSIVGDLKVSADRLQSTIESALGYFRNARSETDSVPASIAECLGMAMDLSVRVPGLQQRTENISAIGNRRVKISTSALEACLLELISNARKFHGNDADLQCSLTMSGDSSLIVELADNGPGIPESALTNVIKPLFQIDEFFTGEKPGLGVGLSMVNETLKTIGGRLMLRNRSDLSGLVVTMCIPLVDEF